MSGIILRLFATFAPFRETANLTFAIIGIVIAIMSCPVCLEHLACVSVTPDRRPVGTPCGHTICKDCFMRLHIKCCPECRFPFEFEAPIHTGMVKLIEKLEKRRNCDQLREDLAKLSEKYDNQNKINHNLARQLVILKKEFAVAKQELEAAKLEIIDSKQELVDVKEEIVDAKQELDNVVKATVHKHFANVYPGCASVRNGQYKL